MFLRQPSTRACPPSGNRTPQPGSPGRTTTVIGPVSSSRSPGFTPRSSATWRATSASNLSSMTWPRNAKSASCWIEQMRFRETSASTAGPPTVSGCATPAASSLRRQSRASPGRTAEGGCPHMGHGRAKLPLPTVTFLPSTSASTPGPNTRIGVTTKKSAP